MLKDKDCRQILAELSKQSLVEIFEIPKSIKDRARSMYLWYVDPARWRSVLLSETHQLLGNLYTRLEHERNTRRLLLDCVEQDDDEDRYLTTHGRTEYEALLYRIRTIRTAIIRADMDRFVLELP